MWGRWAGLRGHVIVICALLGCAAWATPANAQPFPSRPITLVVPFAAGGPTDTLARILSERVAAELHATIVVENVAGASGSIAGARVARATPDGTTITIGHWGTHVLNGAIFKLPYDVIADFEIFCAVKPVPRQRKRRISRRNEATDRRPIANDRAGSRCIRGSSRWPWRRVRTRNSADAFEITQRLG